MFISFKQSFLSPLNHIAYEKFSTIGAAISCFYGFFANTN